MAFKLGDHIYKEAMYLYAEDLTTGDVLYVLTQLNNLNVEVTAESIEITDKNGNVVKKIWRSKAGTLTATNAFVNTNILAASSGSDAVFASENGKIAMPKMFVVNKGEEVTLTGAVDGTVKVAQWTGDGNIGTIYKLGETASETDFAVEADTGKLTLPTDASAEMFFIKYEREVSEGAMIVNSATEFPESVRVIVKATYYNPCSKNEVKADYIEFPSFQVSPEVSFAVDPESPTMDYTGTMEIDYCGKDKVLYRIFSADEIDED